MLSYATLLSFVVISIINKIELNLMQYIAMTEFSPTRYIFIYQLQKAEAINFLAETLCVLLFVILIHTGNQPTRDDFCSGY